MSEATRKPKIHFAAMVGVAFDADLFPYWIAHYKALGLDSYSIFLHEGLDAAANMAAKMLFINSGFMVTMLPEKTVRENPICPGEPGIGVRSVIMDMINLSIHEDDFLLTADGDEIQQWNETPHEAVARGIKIVLGRHVDCFDETLHAPDPAKSLQENYPLEHLSLCSYWKEFPYNTKKICMSPARYPVDFSGSHEVRRHYQDAAPRLVSTGPINVLHYRWRETVLKRVKDRPNWPPEEIAAIKKFFSVEG